MNVRIFVHIDQLRIGIQMQKKNEMRDELPYKNIAGADTLALKEPLLLIFMRQETWNELNQPNMKLKWLNASSVRKDHYFW